MELLRIHAYEVTPQRLAKKETPIRGGAFKPPTEFVASLDDFVKRSSLTTQPIVEFRSTPQPSIADTNSNIVRDLILNYCFGSTSLAKSGAVALAKRLGKSMDARSPFTLLVLSAYRDGDSRRLIAWAFPKDEPYQFSSSGQTAKLKILKNAFSRSSSFKKAALFEGIKSDNTFWNGRVIDNQAESAFGTAADYWVSGFLDARFSLTGVAGTRLLAKALQKTHDTLTLQDDRDQISSAVVALSASKRKSWTMQSFAKEYLEGNAYNSFLNNIPNEARKTSFSIQRPELERKLNFRVFRLEDDVIVSAPFGRIGHSVKLEKESDGTAQRLQCEGIVVDEKMRAKHA